MTYADTSFIGSAYVADANTDEAKRYLTTHEPRLPFLFLHWPEITRAVFTKSTEPDAAWDTINADVLGGVKFHRPDVDADRVGQRAAGMLRNYVGRWPKLRSLDVMHVAAAIETGCKTFLSFDKSSFQRVLAHDQKLEVWPELSPEEKKRL